MPPAIASAKPAGIGYIPELDGVRGIAVLSVMLFHFYDPVTRSAPFGPLLTRLLERGSIGVDIFFVLSGFLITRILVSTETDASYFKVFYARRALRIFPLYAFATALYFYLLLPLNHHQGQDLNIHGSEQIWYWLFLQNWRHAFFFNDGGGLGHFWSLAIEEQFYLVWPFLIRRIERRFLPAFLVGIAALSIALRFALYAHGSLLEMLDFNTFARLDGLALGALLAVSEQARRFARTYGLWILPFALVAVCRIHATVPAMTAATLSGFCLVGVAVTRSVSPLRARWLRTFGKYSYGLYVWHFLVHMYTVRLFRETRPGVFAVLDITVGFGATFALAWMSWRWLEKPFARLKRRFPYGPEIPHSLAT